MNERPTVLHDERKTCKVCGQSFRCPTVQQNRHTCAACEIEYHPGPDDGGKELA